MNHFNLPIDEVLPELDRTCAASPRVVLAAPPGSGKTTGAPLFLIERPWLRGQGILMLEPRRLAARAAAGRMADLLGERPGGHVGYRIRFESCVSARTRIEVVTEGILTRRLQRDPDLAGVGLVIFDEFHERSIHADLALALCLDVQENLREDLRILVMSATLDTAAVSALLGGAPVVAGQGRAFPVEQRYLQFEPQGERGPVVIDLVVDGVLRALAADPGDCLVFLPGGGEIREVKRRLDERLRGAHCVVHPLHGDLGRQEQDLALFPDPHGRRRVVLSTNIAETSLTIEGVSIVVDAGLQRTPSFDPNRALTRLETARVSRAAADQRAGRAGRLGPGVCHRLWTERRHAALVAHTLPEVLSTDLAPLALELALWGVDDPLRLRWLDPPPAGAFAQARELLTGLGALDGAGRITAEGRAMAGLGLHPRLAHLVLAARAHGQARVGAELAAILAERDPFPRSATADLEPRLAALARLREAGGRGAERAPGVDAQACRRILQAADQWLRATERAAEQETGPPRHGAAEQPLTLGGLLAMAFPDRVAALRGADAHVYRLSSGRGARLPEGDPLAGSPFLVVADLDAGQREGRIFLAAGIGLGELREVLQGRIRQREVTLWDGATEAVQSETREQLGELILRRAPLRQADPEALRAAMLEGVRRMGLACLPWEEDIRDLRDRILSLRAWQPEAGWPDLSDEGLLAGLEGWLAPWLDGVTRRDHLRRIDLREALLAGLDWEARKRLDRLAPTHIPVPSGTRKRLQYRPGEAPVLAVRLQEMFGLADTPAVCDGRVPVLLHLLSPAQRPIQVTQDLKGFWHNTYPEVKRELKGRYPKHYWPEDPWSAVPTARVRPR